MDSQQLLSFLGASLLLTIMPGPDNIYVLTESISKGARRGIIISLGLVSGVFVHVMAVATGLSVLVYSSPFAFQVVSYIGAAYLLYLAFQASREKMDFSLQQEVQIDDSKSVMQLLGRGFIMNVTNPKVALFFIAFFPSFILEGTINIVWQTIILGLVFVAQAIIVFSLISLAAGRLSMYFQRQIFRQIAKWVKVLVLFILTVFLLI